MGRTNLTGTKGVSIPPVQAGQTYICYFNHPLIENKRVCRSLGTRDGEKAKDFGNKLSSILHSPSQWHDLPPETPTEVVGIWKQGTGVKPLVPKEWTAPDVYNRTQDAIEALQRKYDALLENFLALKVEDEIKAGLLRQVGISNRKAVTKPLKEAIETFTYIGPDSKSPSKRRARSMRSVKSSLNAFSRFVGEMEPAGNVPPQKVIAYVASRKNKKTKKPIKGEYRKKLIDQLLQFMYWASGNTFDRQAVYDWDAHQEQQPKEDPVWLDEDKIAAMAGHMEEPFRSMFWMQYAAALRAEEVIRLASDALVEMDAGEIYVEIKDLVLDGKKVWQPKTKRSYGKVHLHRRYLGKIGLLFEKNGLFFPNAKGQMWDETDFCSFWRVELRRVAELVGIPDWERIRSKSPRHWAARNIIIELVKAERADAEQVAAIFLRDTVSTVRQYYGRFLPSDVKRPD